MSDANASEPVIAFEEFWSKMTDDQNRDRTAVLQPQQIASLAFYAGVIWAMERTRALVIQTQSFSELTDKSRVDRFGR